MKVILVIITVVLSGFLTNNAEDAAAILSKVDQTIFSLKDKSAEVEMVMINLKTEKTKIKKANFFQKGMDRKLFRYTYPKSDNGIATLTIPDAVYLYLPMFKKPKKITNMAEGNAFNKSDFSLEDMNTKYFSELYEPELMESTARYYILRLIPKDKKSSYKYQVATINKSTYYVEKMEYYNKKGERAKVSESEYVKIDNRWVVSTVSMTNLKKKHKTKFIMTNIKINTGLSDDLFTVENMVGGGKAK